MSLIDNGRALAARLMAKHGVPVTVTRTTLTNSVANRIAGTKGSTGTATVTGKGFLGSIERTLADGTIQNHATATLNFAVQKGDRLAIGTKSFEIVEIDKEIAPDGGAVIITRVVLA